MNILSSLFRRAEKRRAYSDMLHLDDHLLRDIGVSRAADAHVRIPAPQETEFLSAASPGDADVVAPSRDRGCAGGR